MFTRNVLIISSMLLAAIAAPASHHKKLAVVTPESRTYHCPPGYKIQGKTCVIHEIHPMSLICPPGSRESESVSVCTITVPHKRQCPQHFNMSGDRCIRMIKQQPQPFCKSGYVLSSEAVCEKTVFSPPHCPDGYQLETDKCMHYNKKLYKCPHGYIALGKACVKSVWLPKTPVCHEGYTLQDDNTCFKLLPLPEYCPSGYIQSDTGCSQYAAKVYECPEHFTKTSTKHCEKTTKHPKLPTCPPGFSLQGEKCLKHIYPTPFCPHGFVVEKDRCVAYTKLIAKCPQGFEDTHKGCKHVHVFDKEPHCPDAYVLKDSMCVKEIHIPPHCPTHFQLFNENCIKYAPVIAKCPPLFEPSHKGCKKTTKIAKISECPHGYTLENTKCIKVKEEESYSVCDTGDKVHDGCLIIQTAPKLHVCPPGFELLDHECMREETYDCSSPVSKDAYACGAAFRHQVRSNVFERSLLGEYNDNNKYNSYNRYNMGATFEQSSCEPPSPHISKTCTKQHRIPPAETCPDNFDITPSECIKNVIRPARFVQPPPQVLIQEPLLTCPPGGCMLVEKAEEKLFCPEGFTYGENKCFKFADLIQPKPKVITVVPTMVCTGGEEPLCKNIKQIPYEHFCPENFQRHLETCIKTADFVIPPVKIKNISPKFICTHGTGPDCVEVSEMPMHYFCPQGYIDMLNGDQCVRNKMHIVPAPKTVYKKPYMQCTGGEGPKCEVKKTAPFDTFCPNDSVDIGNKCVKSINVIVPPPNILKQLPSHTCKDGFELSGQHCVTSITAPVHMFCQTGHELIGDKCVKFIHKLPVCTLGEKVDGGCKVLKTTKPKVTIVRTCTKGQPGC